MVLQMALMLYYKCLVQMLDALMGMLMGSWMDNSMEQNLVLKKVFEKDSYLVVM